MKKWLNKEKKEKKLLMNLFGEEWIGWVVFLFGGLWPLPAAELR